jgi:putative SOS response-associated peptidase YedK
MCGRFTLRARPELLATLFDLSEVPPLAPRYNIAPTQPVSAVRAGFGGGEREMTFLTWGLIPSWAKDISMGARMINARSETVAEKPSFRAAFKYRRCLVPADGFYEWKSISGKSKQPYLIHLPDHEPFAIAGLWEHWEGPDGSVIESCTLLTTDANEAVRPLHNRMPVILAQDDYEEWLDPEAQDTDNLRHLLRPFPAESIQAYAVTTHVNNPRNEDAGCIEPAPAV